ncbi:hypothetical protein BCR44DRAFT_1442285 [Catenaria anguillulae PL171]|uniref:Uncharacterized protein n=1 Tax=Catenaria anguillulae PL171 TaxID=765915 RepID=A0A1Y2HA00_9FUNG|nr:hypothetical protein BCR44DRAFT_1442285 [Catenaria anguillulae PL171]
MRVATGNNESDAKTLSGPAANGSCSACHASSLKAYRSTRSLLRSVNCDSSSRRHFARMAGDSRNLAAQLRLLRTALSTATICCSTSVSGV